MGWFDPKELKFDISEIAAMRKKIDETKTSLQTTSKTLQDEIAELQKKWNTPAGKDFMKEFDTGWVTQVNKYVEALQGVEEMLEQAEKYYSEVEEKVNKLSF